MRYPASEKLEIIRLVEQSDLPVRRTLAKIGGSVRCVRCVSSLTPPLALGFRKRPLG
jgi:hypothetical protein